MAWAYIDADALGAHDAPDAPAQHASIREVRSVDRGGGTDLHDVVTRRHPTRHAINYSTHALVRSHTRYELKTTRAGMGFARPRAVLAAALCLLCTARAQSDLYDPYTGISDHTPPNPAHAVALRKVRDALKTDPNGFMRFWEGDEPCRAPWRGVRCVRGNRVTHLDLSRFGIGGDIDPAIADIDTLVEIDLSNNFISGEIPAALGNLTRLMTLNLAGNRLRGTIPPELADAPALGRLGLQRNRIGGSIPPEFGDAPSLRSLDVSDNLIEGTVPPQLGNLTGLHELSLGRNLLRGTIPAELYGCVNLYSLRMQGNRLDGTVPSEWGADFAKLESLDLSRNFLVGEVPEGLADIPRLKELRLNDNQMFGTTPAALAAKGVAVLVR